MDATGRRGCSAETIAGTTDDPSMTPDDTPSRTLDTLHYSEYIYTEYQPTRYA